MAVSRHSQEWQLKVGIAMLAGVHFQQVNTFCPGRMLVGENVWTATVRGFEIRAMSKYQAACKALAFLGTQEPLP